MGLLAKKWSSLRWLALCPLILILAWPNLIQITGDLSYLSARKLAQTGNIRCALWLLAQTQQLQPKQPYAYVLASDILYRTGNLVTSIDQLQVGIEEGAVHPILLNDLAVRRYEQGDPGAALKLQEQAAASAPNVAITQHNLGVFLWQARDALAAIRAFREATRIDPKWASPYLSLALIHLEFSDYSEAEENARKAISLQPDHADAYEVLIQSLLAQQKSASALDAIATAETRGAYSDWTFDNTK